MLTRAVLIDLLEQPLADPLRACAPVLLVCALERVLRVGELAHRVIHHGDHQVEQSEARQHLMRRGVAIHHTHSTPQRDPPHDEVSVRSTSRREVVRFGGGGAAAAASARAKRPPASASASVSAVSYLNRKTEILRCRHLEGDPRSPRHHHLEGEEDSVAPRRVLADRLDHRDRRLV